MTYTAKIFISLEMTGIPADDKEAAEEKAFEQISRSLEMAGMEGELTIDCIDVTEAK